MMEVSKQRLFGKTYCG